LPIRREYNPAMRSSIPLLIVAAAGGGIAIFAIPGCATEGSTIAAGQAAANSSGELYQGKTAAQWIVLLSSSDDARVRAQAAEALGFIAREGHLTYGGFSDVPIDSADPPRLSEEALRPIIAALVVALSDSEGSVRASSAIALSWIGPRAKAAVPVLTRQLDDADGDARKSALTAIGRMGPLAKEAIPRLQTLLTNGRGHDRTNVAEAMRLIGAAPDSYVPTLIANLTEDGSGSAPGYYAALELGQLGDPAAPALLQALKVKSPARRKYAAYAFSNMAGWDKLTKNRDEVAQALINLTRDEDRDVVWHAAQAIGSVHAAPDHCVPALVALLKHPDRSVAETAAESLGEFGAAAKPALPALIGLLGQGNDEFDAAYAIRQIGIDDASAGAICKLKLSESGSWFFIPLCAYPEAAIEFIRQNPHAVDVPVRDRDALLALIRDPKPPLEPLRELLYQNEQLPLPIMAELGDARFLPLIERRLKAASAHKKTQWAACARACGAPADRVVTIDASRPGDFKPKSAWPGTDRTRLSPTAQGHGDGFTELIITGQILRSDGAPAAVPKFYRTNDAMLLGKRIRKEEPLTFDPKTGRFVFVTTVFAAYSTGDDQPEPGPYQTGSSQIQIESAGCKPLQLQFYDEMPDVRITLPADK
jgi:HEAT repeat protein